MILLVLGALLAGYYLGANKSERGVQPPNELIELMGVELSATADEVSYVKGSNVLLRDRKAGACVDDLADGFPCVLRAEEDIRAHAYEAHTKREEADYLTWVYAEKNQILDVYFHPQDGRVRTVFCWDSSDELQAPPYGCGPIYGIMSGSSEDEIKKTLGSPTSTTLSDGVKTMTYEPYNVRFYLRKRLVTSIVIFETMDDLAEVID